VLALPRTLLVVSVAVVAACKTHGSSGAAPSATVEPPPPAASWKRVTFELLRASTRERGITIDLYPDGRAVFSGGLGGIPSVGRAPNALLGAIEPWSKRGLPTGNADAGVFDAAAVVFFLHVRIERGRTREAEYRLTALPPDLRAIYTAAEKLFNAPRHAVPCRKWDGRGDFTLSLQSQNFGVVPGPVDRITIHGDGTAARSVTSGVADAKPAVVATTTLSAAEVEAIRSAVVAQDLGHFDEVSGGAGEGSNFRSVELTTATAGECPRAFTNRYPDAMKPLLDAVAPVSARLARSSRED
jgi:hypothetical protein